MDTEGNRNEVSVVVPDMPETRKFLSLATGHVVVFTVQDILDFGPCLFSFFEPHYRQAVQEVISKRLEEMAGNGRKSCVVDAGQVIDSVLLILDKRMREEPDFKSQYWEAFLADCVVRADGNMDTLRTMLREMIEVFEKDAEPVPV